MSASKMRSPVDGADGGDGGGDVILRFALLRGEAW